MEFPENNDIGDVVTNINTQEGVSLELLENPDNAFKINGTSLVANIKLDYEVIISFTGMSVILIMYAFIMHFCKCIFKYARPRPCLLVVDCPSA